MIVVVVKNIIIKKENTNSGELKAPRISNFKDSGVINWGCVKNFVGIVVLPINQENDVKMKVTHKNAPLIPFERKIINKKIISNSQDSLFLRDENQKLVLWHNY